MADYARIVRDAGAKIVGGCCGTSPEHLKAIRGALETHEPAEKPTLEQIVARLGPLTEGARAQLAGEGPAAPARRGRRRDRSTPEEAAF
jgi:5-methyltetrahydrofolate--homocysteine methyltransferase